MKLAFLARNAFKGLKNNRHLLGSNSVQSFSTSKINLNDTKTNKTDKKSKKEKSMEEFSKTNPYFAKYEAKLKAVYK
jgi:hypothetical protein